MRWKQQVQGLTHVELGTTRWFVVNLKTPQVAVGAMFLLNGSLFGIWASRIPAFVERFGLSAHQLGLVLLAMALGAILAFPLAGRLSDRLGASLLSRRVAFLYVLAFCSLAFAPALWVFGISLAVFGVMQGTLDVTMNAWGAEVEKHQDRPLMSRLHAMFSLGAGLGAASGYLAVRIGLGVGPYFLLVGSTLGIALLAVSAVPWQSRLATSSGVGAVAPRGALALVGLVAFCASLGEGAVADWSAVFLYTVTDVTEAQSTLGYAAFSAAMVVMRLTGDRVVHRWGPVLTARLSGVLVAIGVIVGLAGHGINAVLLGFMLMGAGYAVIAPLAFSRAAADPEVSPGLAIARVATFGYGGLLLGPPLIGFIAAGASLQVGLGLLGGLAVLITLLAPSLATTSERMAASGARRRRTGSLRSGPLEAGG